MGYSLRTDDAEISEMPGNLRVSDEEWNRYPFASREDLQWFRDAKYGLFIHHGICALGKAEIGWSRHTHKMPDRGTGPIPDNVYDGWSRQFKMEHFDAGEWAKTALDGGMKYVVIITKHHDGFHLWDTMFSEHKITRSPFGRDYLRELVDAFRKEGLKIGFYFSQRDFYHPDYEPVDPAAAYSTDKPPFFAMNPGKIFSITEKHKKYITYMHNAVKELMTNYGRVDLLWWDADYCNGMFPKEMWDSEAIEKEIRGFQPRIIINNRAGLAGDYDTPECKIGEYRTRRPWETCMPLTGGWSWTDTPVKPFAEVLGLLVQCVCGDGNFLLSIGAMADGRLAPNEMERIAEIGAWLKKYGESIYGTRGGPYKPEAWGGSCHKGDTVYLHITGFEKLERLNADNNIRFLTLPSLAGTGGACTKAECLTGEKVSTAQAEGAFIKLQIDPGALKNTDTVIKLTIPGTAVIHH
jgi:hypothetical protein